MAFRGIGYIYAALSAGLYGLNPIFSVPLYGMGMNAVSVLLFRYLLGIPLLAAYIVFRSERLIPRRHEVAPMAVLGLIMGFSSWGLFDSYNYMNPGVASTLLFMYPVLTALIMTLFFHEKFRPIIGICLAIMCLGIYLLMQPPADRDFSMLGFTLIFLSSLTYAFYLVMLKTSRVLPHVPATLSLLYQLLFGCLIFIFVMFCGSELVLPSTFFEWSSLLALALFPTVVSLLLTIEAINYIGPTPTAIFGALDPITAVVLSWLILGDAISVREIAGGALILAATMLVVAADRDRR